MRRLCVRAGAGATTALHARTALRAFSSKIKYVGDVGNYLSFQCVHPAATTLTPRDFRGRVVLVVNTASTCATAAAQLPALQQLYTTYHARGLDVVAVPSNDFDKKEPLASDMELAMVYTAPDGPFQVTFPVAAKSAVIGDNAHAFFAHVAKKYGRSVAPTWNFDKFLVDVHGDLCAVFPHDTEPLVPEVIEAIEDALAEVPTEKDLEADGGGSDSDMGEYDSDEDSSEEDQDTDDDSDEDSGSDDEKDSRPKRRR